MKRTSRFTPAITFLIIFACLRWTALAIADVTTMSHTDAERISLVLTIVILAFLKFKLKVFDKRYGTPKKKV